MVSTYILSAYDYCPFDGTENFNGALPYYIDGVSLWTKSSGKKSNMHKFINCY